MTDDATTAPTPDSFEPWERLLEDARTIDAELGEAGWETVLLDPNAVVPIENDDRTGVRILVDAAAHERVVTLLERDGVTFSDVDVYRQTEGETTVALAVERDDEAQTAVLIPLYYDRTDARSVLEAALDAGHLFVYVEVDDADAWVVFAHDDPTLFFAEEDVATVREESADESVDEQPLSRSNSVASEDEPSSDEV